MQKLKIKDLDVGDYLVYKLGKKAKVKRGFVEEYSTKCGTVGLDRCEDVLTESTDILEHIKFPQCNVACHRDIKDNGAGLGWRIKKELFGNKS